MKRYDRMERYNKIELYCCDFLFPSPLSILLYTIQFPVHSIVFPVVRHNDYL